ncbi:thioesterase family protein [Erythrobacter sp. LQ02-29]|uniref:acyl-CoA thioesterase n=1 Tax=Erythrobacter sp. LQ02-29 TaxID=2920384 RepID=UPI001F4DE368|nr:thioesterase family protein [Erythrobacter sp. LQ02-29]MCP9221600.1 thioesterase family protein [Erythrobacter sp. LQ02-29]
MSALDLIAPVTDRDATITLPADPWMQGRTLYGGASALVAYTAAVRRFPELPPLRSGQVGFVAPIGETVTTRVAMIRQGRNVAQVRSELLVDGEVALTAFFLFGTAREANARHSAPRAEPWPGSPEENADSAIDQAPAFLANNYEVRRAQDRGWSGPPVIRRWVRLKDGNGLDPTSRIVLMGDTLPPGAMRAMERPGPLSSINWTFNLLDPAPETRDGWFLTENASVEAADGYSTERLRMWDADGRQVVAGQQLVAIFG